MVTEEQTKLQNIYGTWVLFMPKHMLYVVFL